MRGSGTFKPSTIASRRGPLDWMIRPHMPDIYAIAHRGQLTGCWGHLREPTDRGKLPNREPGGHGSAHGPEHAPGPDPGRPWPGQLDDPPAEEICRGTGTLGSQSDCPFVGRLSPPSPASGFDTKRPRCLATGLFFCPNRALPHHVSHADRARIAKMPPGTIRRIAALRIKHCNPIVHCGRRPWLRRTDTGRTPPIASPPLISSRT